MQQVYQFITDFFPLFDSELYRKMQSMCALLTKTAQWTRGGETAASSAVSRNVLQWEWSKKVIQCQTLLKPSVTVMYDGEKPGLVMTVL